VVPSMTLGSGGIGGAITGDNITVQHLYNVKRIAYEINMAPEAAFLPGSTDDIAQRHSYTSGVPTTNASTSGRSTDPRIDEIVRRVLAELKK
jgi:acetaldehyde dehydrogenase (acetylating)